MTEKRLQALALWEEGTGKLLSGDLDEAVSWFERAKKASRYEPRHFPYLNLGRLHAARGDLAAAVAEFEGALEENPEDPMARRFLESLKYRVN